MTTSRWVSRIAWIAAAVLALLVVFWLRGALLPFIVGGIIAYALFPLVSRIEPFTSGNGRWPGAGRVAAIILVYLLAAAVVALVLVVVVPPAITQARDFIASLPELIQKAVNAVQNWDTRYSSRLPPEIAQQAQALLHNAGAVLGSAAQGLLGRAVGLVSHTLTIVIAFAVVPMFVFYALKDREQLREGLVSAFPVSVRPHVWNVVSIVNGVFSAWVRGQLVLSLSVGILVFIGLTLVGAPYAIWLAVVSGLTESIPTVGAWLGAIPGVLVALATDPGKAPFVIAVYAGAQIIENVVLIPNIHARYLKLHPIVIMLVLVIGSEIAGLWGVILGPVLAAAIKEVYAYFRDPGAMAPSSSAPASPAGAGPLAQSQARADGDSPDGVRDSSPGLSLADDLLPAFDIRLTRSQTIPKPRSVVFKALHEAPVSEMPLYRTLMAVRSLGRYRAGRAPFLDGLRHTGTALVEEQRDRQVATAYMGPIWRLKDPYLPLRSREQFSGEGRADIVKVVTAYTLEDASGGTRLTVETRLKLPQDPGAARSFRSHWRLMGRAGAGAWARGLLAAVRRRAERASP